MAIKLNTTSGSITLDAEDGSGNVNVTLPRAGFEVGDITGVTAGTGLTGGGTSGAVTLTVGAAQTGITSIYATDLILGEDTQTAIDFGTANEIDFKVDNATRLTMTSGAVYPITTNQIDLGTASLEFKDAFFDGTVTADAFAGPLTGTATTVTTNANLTGHVTSTGNAAVLGSFTSAQLSTALSDETGSGSAVFATSPTLVTPALGTPASGVATNLSGTAASLTAGNVTTNANLTGHITSTGNAAVLGSFTSAQLKAALSDETGSGTAVFATSPTLVTPVLGTPASGTLTNATGLPAAGVVGTAAVLGANTYTGTQNLADNTLQRANLLDYGEVTNAIGGTGGGTQDIDLTAGNCVSATVNTSANTFTFSNPTASDELCGFVLFLTNGGSQTVTWPGTVDWPAATAPTLSASGLDIIVFQTIDGGTIWHGQVASTLSS